MNGGRRNLIRLKRFVKDSLFFSSKNTTCGFFDGVQKEGRSRACMFIQMKRNHWIKLNMGVISPTLTRWRGRD